MRRRSMSIRWANRQSIQTQLGEKMAMIAKKQELMGKLASEALPDFAAKFEKSLKDNGGKFFVGDELTYADIWDECVQKSSNSAKF